MERESFIKYAIIIIIIMAAAYLSQQAYAGRFGKKLISDSTSQAASYLSKGSNWAMSKIFPKITDKVQSGGEAIKTATKTTVDQQKNNISENSGSVVKKIENYFSNVGNSIVGKPSADCPAPK